MSAVIASFPECRDEPAPLAAMRGVVKSWRRAAGVAAVLEAPELTVPPGDFLALMGPSGAGKSVLLNLLGGLDRPDAGTIAIGGRRIDTLNDRALAAWRARSVGFVFQGYQLLPMLSAEQNVELPLMLARLPRAERLERARTTLNLVGLAGHYRHKPAELSGGQAKRVGIARAIAADPGLLLLDEPTGDLDRSAGAAILELLRTLNREHGKTIVMTTHDRRAAARANRTLYMNDGRLSEEPTLTWR